MNFRNCRVTKARFTIKYYYWVLKPGQWYLFEELGTHSTPRQYKRDTRKRFDALGREVYSRRRAPCQEADIAANETLRSVCVCVYVFVYGVQPARWPTELERSCKTDHPMSKNCFLTARKTHWTLEIFVLIKAILQ